MFLKLERTRCQATNRFSPTMRLVASTLSGVKRGKECRRALRSYFCTAGLTCALAPPCYSWPWCPTSHGLLRTFGILTAHIFQERSPRLPSCAQSEKLLLLRSAEDPEMGSFFFGNLARVPQPVQRLTIPGAANTNAISRQEPVAKEHAGNKGFGLFR